MTDHTWSIRGRTRELQLRLRLPVPVPGAAGRWHLPGHGGLAPGGGHAVTIRTGWWTTCLENLPAKERVRGKS